MSNTKHINDGGPAFPVGTEIYQGAGLSGMTLRDWFAGQALAGYLSNRVSMTAAIAESREKNIQFPTYMARLSYEMAGAMIATRSQNP